MSEPSPPRSLPQASPDEPAVVTPADPSEIGEALDERLDLGGRTLREHAARGVVINSAFQIGLAGFGLSKRVAVAAFLTTSEFGFWGILLTTLVTLSWLKQIGVSDKYIQQDDPDQELAFQKAFTLELYYTLVFYAIVCVAIPIYSLIYDRPDFILPSFVLSLALLGTIFQTPIWIAYRQMRFVRQRVLEAVGPVVMAIVTIALAVAGAGYWSLVIGAVVGTFVGAIPAVITCPYRLRLRYDRGTLKEYFSFSWPVFLANASSLIVVQVAVIVGNVTVGLAGLGVIGLATTFSRFGGRVEEIVKRTMYPAVCAVKDRREVMFETFVKSNRLGLMWAVPFGLGLTLFAGDLITYVLGEKWRVAEFALQGFGGMVALGTIGYSWTVFFSARSETRPLAVSGALTLVSFMAITVPLMFSHGVDGYVIGFMAMALLSLGLRAYYLRRLFPGFRLLRHAVRAIVPTVPAVLAILVVRATTDVERSLGVALGELGLYMLVAVAATAVLERDLLREIWGYVRRGVGPAATVAPESTEALAG